MTATDDPPATIRMGLWFGIVVFARLYTVLLCDVADDLIGIDWFCDTWFQNIPVYLWVELVVYGPIVWFALYQVNADVFRDPPPEPDALRRHRRRRLIGAAAAAIFLYGVGIHATDTLEVLDREQGIGPEGAAADLVEFLDEGLSHYVQFGALFFLLGWFVLFDRVGRTVNVRLALFLGVAHAVERSVGIVEGQKWLTGPAVMVWLVVAVWLRRRRIGGEVLREFFVLYAIAFVAMLPIALGAYYLWFGSFTSPSELPDDQYAELAAGVIAIGVVGAAAALAGGRFVRGSGEN